MKVSLSYAKVYCFTLKILAKRDPPRFAAQVRSRGFLTFIYAATGGRMEIVMTERLLFCDGWSFREAPLNTDYNDALTGVFTPVEIPHDYMIYDVNALYRNGEGWYRRTLNVTDKKGVYILRFEGVYMNSTVFVNGLAACEWKYGYSTFEADITPYLSDGDNEIVVRCVYQNPNTRWYSGAGIYRRVWLIKTEEHRIPSDSVYITTEKTDDTWYVHVDTETVGDGDVKSTVLDADGNVLGSAVGASVSIPVIAPRLWDPDDPYLHTVVTELISDGKPVDRAENVFGFRTIRFDTERGFFINGKNLKLHGVCEHHDNGALGSAVNKAALRRKIQKLKTMGVNSIRTSHNMPAVELVELCDEMGIVIIDEAFDMWEHHKTKYDYAAYFSEWYERDVKSWITRDRNHPCVIMWSIGNEIGDTTTERGLEVTKMLIAAVRRHDPRRNAAITVGSNHMRSEWGQKCALELDAVGYNYAEKLYAEHHEKYPTYCIYGSETSSTIQSRGIYHFPHEDKSVTHADHQCSSIFNCTTSWASPNTEYNITRDRAAEYCAGQYIWTGFDYIGEPTPYDTKNSYFGQIDTAGFPKDSYYAYRAEWTDGDSSPMVHITPSVWDFNEGEIIDVTVHSNAARSELYCNGVLVGRFDHDHSVGSMKISEFYKIPYVKGTLSAVAYDKNGNVVARDEVKSFGDPDRIVLEPEKTVVNADGRDMCYVAISTVDADGNHVGNARNRMNVTVSGCGRLVGLDNGDSTDYEQYKCTSRRLFSGRLMAVIAAKAESGEIKVTVSSPDLPTETVTLTALPSTVPAGIEIIDECVTVPEINEIPLRKIELSVIGSKTLTKDSPSANINAKTYPENASVNEIQWCAYSRGIPTELLKIEDSDGGVTVTALADGEYRLRAFSNNGTKYPCVYSEIIFTAEGIGEMFIDPYKRIPAALGADEATQHTQESEGGIRFFDADCHAVFRRVDFGDNGADGFELSLLRVHTPDTPFRLYDVTDSKDELIGEYFFTGSKDWWVYSTNSYKLSSPITGIRDIKIVFTKALVFGGFRFHKINPAYKGIPAGDCNVVYGDDYERRGGAIYNIGNNVTVGFKNVDLSDGAVSVTVRAKTKNERDSIRISIGGDIYTAVFTAEDEEVTLPVSASGIADIDLVFLPGCNFDLHSIRFNK